ncbi:MAG: hypothetical protein JGK06_14120 [Microcoleus sp. PH2017_36_ELK_O_B]|nr:hypothetical protein [Microcoleus sp. PH2017_36_ELK_O_B]
MLAPQHLIRIWAPNFTDLRSRCQQVLTKNFTGGTRHVIYPWNQSQIENRKSSLPPNLSKID